MADNVHNKHHIVTAKTTAQWSLAHLRRENVREREEADLPWDQYDCKKESLASPFTLYKERHELNFQFVHPLAPLLSQSSIEYIQRHNWFRQRIPRFRLWGCSLVNTTSHIRLNGEVTCRSQPAIPPSPDWSFFFSSSSSSRSLRLV
jgi:hypothetical protein